jgi:hypothetical protein
MMKLRKIGQVMDDSSLIATRSGLVVTACVAFLVVTAVACSTGNTGDGGTTSAGGSTAGSASGVSGASSGASSGGSSGSNSGSAGTGGDSGTTGSSGSGSGGQAAGGAGSVSGGPYYVSPTGTGSACSSAAPCSITQAQTTVRAATSAMQNDVIVDLADGVYALTAPLVFTAADSGDNGHQVIWQAATGAHPTLSGAKPVTGWALSDAGKNIWKASAPGAFATRQLYVDGKLATRARSSSISRADMTINNNGWTFSNNSLSYLKNLAQPQRAELNIIGSWTNRYSPIQSVANNTVTMAQPAWEENTWGYDTVQSPYRQGPIYAENDYTLLDQPGEWYQDTTAGALYYIPLPGQDMTKADVELPQLQLLLAVGGTYDQPAHDLTFSGLTFAYTSWLGPNSSDGFADQQTGGFVVGPRSMYPAYEATRPLWRQVPGAVQVSAAQKISFVRDRFVDLGSVGLGIGNDDNAHQIGVGLGANTISVTGCVFNQIAGGGIVIGGIQAKAHHPGGDVAPSALTPAQLAMVDQNMIINDNLIHDVGIDYRDFAGIMFTYTQKVVVTHNEVYNVPYSAIASGLGWGTNDAGGNSDYKTRATGDLYLYQPLYANPTIAMNNTISANSVHQMQLQMNDGGCHYHLSANPGTVVTENYCEGKGSGLSGVIWGEYEDEGSAYVTITKNVYANFGYYVTANSNAANNTGHLTFTNNWGSSASPGLNGPGNVVMGNIAINGDNFPADAQAIVSAAGLEAAYADLKMNP